jgi:glycerol uptake facilitator-like aquaporin
MSAKAKVSAAVLAAPLATAVAATSNNAEARGWGPVLAGALFGASAAAHAYAPGYSYNPAFQRCVPQYDGYSRYIDSIRICSAVPY